MDRLKLKHAKIAYRKFPYIVLMVDHLTWESLRRENGPRLRIVSEAFQLESISTSGTIRKIKEKIKALELSLHMGMKKPSQSNQKGKMLNDG